ncbi:MAG: glycoside hydrolase family 2 TIM barrel-domain containing protein [Bacteroidota bacterium]
MEKVKNEDPNWLDGINFRHEPDPELEDGQYNWTFKINGIKTFIQGMNFIPVDAMLDLSPEIYRYTLRSAADANVNMLRVWGEGLYETDDFYNICDELGILVWQDFWVGSFSPAQPQEKSWEAVVANLKRTRNHPSLVMYCGGNEFDATRKDRLEQITTLEELIQQYDGTRAFHKASPHGGSVHGGMGIVPKEKRNLMYGRFSAEAGYQQSWPPKSDMLKFLKEDQLFPLEENIDILSKHNAMVASIPDVSHAVYGVPQNVDELIHAEMLHNVIGWQAQIENMRLERYKVSGCLFWALNDVWPTTSWSMIDWYGTRKNHYYAFKKGTAPLQATASQQHQIVIPSEAYDLEICLINDNLKSFEKLSVEASIYLGEKAQKVYTKSFVGGIEENAVSCLGRLDWMIPEDTKEHNFLLVLKTTDEKGTLLARNEYTCLIGGVAEVNGELERVSTSGGFFAEYKTWTKNRISPMLVGFPQTLDAGEEESFEIVYENTTDNVLMGLETLITNLPTGVRLYLDDNYIHVLPGEKRTINASLENTRRFQLDKEVELKLQVDGWNVETMNQSLQVNFIGN